MKEDLAKHIIKKGFTYTIEVEPVIMRESIKLDPLVDCINEYLIGEKNEHNASVS